MLETALGYAVYWLTVTSVGGFLGGAVMGMLPGTHVRINGQEASGVSRIVASGLTISLIAIFFPFSLMPTGCNVWYIWTPCAPRTGPLFDVSVSNH